MAILDKRTEFCDATAVNAAAGTALVGSQIDASVIRDLGNGEPVYLCITIDTAIITGGGAGTVQFILASDAQAAIATDGSASEHWRSKAFTTGAAAFTGGGVGAVIVCIPLPTNGAVPYEEFLGILVVTATTTTTAGKINAWLSLDPIEWKAYAQGNVGL